MEKQMDMEFMFKKMVRSMKVSGKIIANTVPVKINFLMVQVTMVNMKMD